ncbi:glycosyltransferase family 2 protein [Endozoicomonas sp. 4G]|uniref:glycosyltransferase family 2 protein n=1 Tax=Endozoicomonas sp. 4G TaxID=2872754 RepID=UPI0020789EDB|nr:glycosyltransferase family 2 protein [Endozoicomonas sp. 4G]
MTNGSSPLISIIIPSYNYAQFLPDTIKSVTQQIGDDCELIVINDGSTDNTDEVMQELLLTLDDNITYISQENQGVPVTRNRGVKLAKGDYLLFLDSDDTLLPDAIDKFRCAIKNNHDADFIIARYYSVNAKGQRKPRCLWELSDSREVNFKNYVTDETVSMLCSSILFRKNIFEHFEFPDHIPQSEDESLFAHIFANFNVIKINDYVSNILKHDDSLRGRYYPELHDLPNILTEVLFDPEKIPAEFMKYKEAYKTLKHLDQFRSLYLNKKYGDAIEEYWSAFSLNKATALKANFFRKLIKAYIKKWL